MSIEIKETYDRIYRYCYYKMQNAANAEDVTQETFLRYFAQNIEIKNGGDMAYLYTIARNLCIDKFRQKKTEELTDKMLENTNSSEDLEKDCTNRVAIRLAMEHLSEQAKELVALRYISELSVKEVATVLTMSRFAVYRMEQSALKEMKKYLRGGNEDA